MKNKKVLKEFLPIAVLLVFIVVVLVLCAVSAGKKKNQELAAAEVTVEAEQKDGAEDTSEFAAAAAEKEEASDEEVEEAAPETAAGADSTQEVQETIELDEAVEAEAVAEEAAAALEAADLEKEKEQAEAASSMKASSGTVSSNSTTVVTVKKTNVEMLAEMMDYWSKGNIAAIEDLSGLAHYRAMSASLKSPSYFYYYGERNADGAPEGKGIAVYGSDQYYYGDWKNGMREGDGMWVRMYYENSFTVPGVNTVLNTLNEVNSGKAVGFSVEPDPVLISHRYRGSWAQDLPNGEGHEQYILDIEQAEPSTYYFQNVMGNFKNGLYDGAMYLITIDSEGNVKEWNGKAAQGVFESFDARDEKGRVPIWQDKQNADSHMWIYPLNNIDLGLTELRTQVRERTE